MAVMPIPNDWDGETYQCCIIQWPASPQWWAIFLGFVTTPMVGRFWDGRTGSILDAQAIGRAIQERNNCLWEFTTMGCLEELTAAIMQLANVATGGGCGCGSYTGINGAGGHAEPPSDFVDNGTNVPDGYASVAAYHVQKCNLAQYILNQIVDDMERIKTNVLITTTTLDSLLPVLGLVVLTPIPFDDLIVIGLAVISALSLVIFNGVMDAAINAIEDSTVSCALVNADTAEDAVELVGIAIDNATSGESEPGRTLIRNIAKSFLTTDVINPLFEANNEKTYPTADCSGCICEDRAGIGVITSQTATQDVASSAVGGTCVPDGTYHTVQIFFNNDGANCGPERQITAVSFTGFTETSGGLCPRPYFGINDLGTQFGRAVGPYDINDVLNVCLRQIQFHSKTAFSVTITVEDC